MFKKILLGWLRRMNWMHRFDRLYFLINKLRYHKKNSRFKKQHPEERLPPEYMLYEAYKLDYADYFTDGRETALWLNAQFSAYGSLSGKNLLEWGCGPARIVRHFPELLPHTGVYATDYNRETIAWCIENIRGIHFTANQLAPPLHYPDDFFDAVYALSVFTHLSAEKHHLWLHELYRILKPGGVILFTTQGKIFMSKLTRPEKKIFLNGGIVVRSRVQEGHRSFSAFQPRSFVQSLFSNRWEVQKFTEGARYNWGPEQDTWIIKKL